MNKEQEIKEHKDKLRLKFYKNWIDSLVNENTILKDALKNEKDFSTDEELDEWLMDQDYK